MTTWHNDCRCAGSLAVNASFYSSGVFKTADYYDGTERKVIFRPRLPRLSDKFWEDTFGTMSTSPFLVQFLKIGFGFLYVCFPFDVKPGQLNL